MRVRCFDHDTLEQFEPDVLPVRLFAQPPRQGWVSIGSQVARRIRVERFEVPPAAKDFLRIAMAVVAADRGVLRSDAENKWTRQIDLEVPVELVSEWTDRRLAVERMLNFLSGDLWTLRFKKHTMELGRLDDRRRHLNGSCVALLSGGADSLVGALDLAKAGVEWIAVSQTSSETTIQGQFAHLASATRHLGWTHGVRVPGTADGSQRARSIGFFAFALVAATSTLAHRNGFPVTIHASENGLISLNPPLTSARVGSASTRTTHPSFITHLQGLFDGLGLHILLKNEYQYMTKGEMFQNCTRPDDLARVLHTSMSCGKPKRLNKHCGRCIPCIIRRASFLKAGIPDKTKYEVGPKDEPTKFFASDDVKCATIGSRQYADFAWLKRKILPSLAFASGYESEQLIAVAGRGLQEVHDYLKSVSS